MLVRFESMPLHGFRGISDFERDIDRLFSGFLGGAAAGYSDHPLIDVADGGGDIVVTAALPGVTKDELKISIQDGLLEISGQRKKTDLPEGSRLVRNEITSGSFARCVSLPEDIDREKVSAELKDGLLKVVLPRMEQRKPREITIR